MTVKHTVFVAGLVFVALMLAACAAVDLGDLIHARTPASVQQQTGLPSKLSLNEAEAEYRAWVEQTRLAAAQWRSNIERSNEVRGLLGQITLGALDQIGPTLAGVPVLGPALPALTGLAGLFLGGARLRKEKEASFNKGLEEGGVLARGGRVAGAPQPGVPTGAAA